MIEPGSSGGSGLRSGSSVKSPVLSGKSAAPFDGRQGESLGRSKEPVLAVVDLEEDDFARAPFHLERPIGPAEGQGILAHDGQSLAIAP